MFESKYVEAYTHAKLGVIPVNGKRPVEDSWQKYCNQQPTQHQLDLWMKGYSECNIGLPLGPANNLVALDIDTNDSYVLNVLPKSPLIKKGKTGETRFFKYKEQHQNKDVRLKKTKQAIVQLLSTGKQTVVPPSIHPETKKPFNWVTEFKLDEVDDLAYLPDNIYEILDHIQDKYDRLEDGINDKSEARHNKLLEIGVAQAFDGHTDAYIIDSLIAYDNKHHSTPWFKDRDSQTPKAFMSSIRKMSRIPPNPDSPIKIVSVNQNININTQEDIDIDYIQEIGESFDNDLDSKLIKPVPFPMPKEGLLKDIYQQIQALSAEDITPLAVLGAHSILKAIFAHRFHIKRNRTNDLKLNDIDIWPHGFALCIAPTGWGKSFAPKFLEETIMDAVPMLDSQIYLNSGFGTGHGVIYDLSQYPRCFTILEEVSQLFKLATDSLKTKDHISEKLCEVWSKCYGRVGLGTTKESAQKGKVTASNPALTVLGFTTRKGFETSVSKDLNDIGLIPRFRIVDCFDWTQDDKNLFIRNDDQIVSIVNKISNIVDGVGIFTKSKNRNEFFNNDKNSADLSRDGQKIVPHSVGLSEELARDWLYPNVQQWSRQMMQELPHDHVMQGYLNRCVEHVLIEALDMYLGKQEWDISTSSWFKAAYPNTEKLSIDVESLEYGLSCFKHSLYDRNRLSQSLNVESSWARIENRILEYIGSNGPRGTLLGQIGNKVRDKDRTRVLESLILDGRVALFKHGQKKRYVLASQARRFKQEHPLYSLAKR